MSSGLGFILSATSVIDCMNSNEWGFVPKMFRDLFIESVLVRSSCLLEFKDCAVQNHILVRCY